MLIPIKNIELYRRWLAHLGENNAQNRTIAFFNSQKGIAPSILV